MDMKDALDIIFSDGDTRQTVADRLGVSPAMLSHYIHRTNLPSLIVAAKLWGEFGLVVEPFTEKAVIKRWTELHP